jgi:hypothetical protein
MVVRLEQRVLVRCLAVRPATAGPVFGRLAYGNNALAAFLEEAWQGSGPGV